MPDEDDLSTPPAIPIVPKKETVRITLPPKPMEAGAAKRDTVRIGAVESGSETPKKETTRVSVADPDSGITRAITPPPAPTMKPLSSTPSSPPASIAPRPPTLGAKPSIGIRPPGAAITARLAPLPPASPAPGADAVKPGAPKKETARIQVPPQPKPMVPKATVRMPNPAPQPMVSAPPTSIVPITTNTMVSSDSEPMIDSLIVPLSAAAFVVSLVSLVLSYLAYAS